MGITTGVVIIWICYYF